MNNVDQPASQHQQGAEIKLTHGPTPAAVDIGELQRMVAELQQAKADLEAKRYVETTLARFAALVRWQKDDDLESWVNRLLEEIVAAVGGLQACLYMTEDRAEGRFLRVAGAYAYHRENLEDAIPFGEGILGQAARSAKTQLYTNLGDQFETRSYTGLAVFRPRTLLVQVLLYNDQVEGVLEVSSLGDFTPSQLDLIRALSENIAANMMAIRNQEEVKRLYQEAQQKTEELLAQDEEMRQNMEELEATQEEMKRSQKELAAREARLNGVLNSVADGIITINEQGVIQSANPACERLFGYKMHEILGQNVAMLTGREHAANHDQYMANYMKTGVAKMIGKGRRLPARRKDGSEFQVFLTVTELHTPDGERLFIGVLRDITDQVRAEQEQQELLEQIRASEEELRQNLEEMTATQEQLKLAQVAIDTKNADLESILAAIDRSTAVIEFTPEGNILTANANFLHLMGYTLADVQGQHHRVFMYPEDTASADYQAFWQDLHAGRPVAGEFRRRTRTGSPAWIVGSYNPILDRQGRLQKIVKFASDVTASKLLQQQQQEMAEELRASEEELRQNLEEMQAAQDQMKAMQAEIATKNADLESILAAIDRSTAVIEFTPDGNILRANPNFLNLMGYTGPEVLGKHHRIFVFPEDAQSPEYQAFWQSLQAGRPVVGEFRRMTRAGSPAWIAGSYNPVFDANGKLAKVIKFATDITTSKLLQQQQQEMAEELRTSEEELRQNLEEMQAAQDQMKAIQAEVAAKNADLGSVLAALDRTTAVIEFDLHGHILKANPIFLALMGYTEPEVVGKHHRIFVRPEDAESDLYNRFWLELAAGRPMTGEFQRVARDGSLRWIMGSYNPVFDAQGNLVKYVKFAQDITAIKRMQEEQQQEMAEELRTSEEELRQYLEEMQTTQDQLRRVQAELDAQVAALNNAAIVSETDLRGNITYANDTFCQISGYSRDELIGQNHRMLKSGHQPDDIFRDLWRTIAQGNVWKGIIKNRRKDGTYYWVNSTITPIHDENGKLVKFVAVRFDVTAEMELAAALEQQRQQLEAPSGSHHNGAPQAVDPDVAAMLSAIDRANAVVEFDMDGNIIRANDKFLELVGYDPQELHGQHHHNLVPEHERQSPDYQAFWDALRQGHSIAGQFIRRHKDGSDVWLHGHYHPVLDANGQPVKVLKLAAPITPVVPQ